MSETFNKRKQETPDEPGTAQLDVLMDTSPQQAQSEERSPDDDSEEYETDIIGKDSEQELFLAEVSVRPPKVTLSRQKQSKNHHRGEDGEEVETLIGPSHESEQTPPESREVQLKNPEEISGIESQNPIRHGSLEGGLGTASVEPQQGLETREDPEGGGIQPDGHFENRDIFETGGDQSGLDHRNVRGTSETFSGDIPVSETGFGEVEDSTPPPRCCPRCCPMVFCPCRLATDFRERVAVWWEFSTCRNRLVESPLSFVFAFIVCVVCVMMNNTLPDDEKDIPICVLAVTLFCCANSLSCRRYWLDYTAVLADMTDDQDQEELIGVCDCGSILRNMCCDCCFCCFGDLDVMPPSRRRWHPRRRDNNGSNTAFVHEVVDVSKLDPRHCPQIRHVDNEVIYESISPDYFNPPIGKADAVVHLPDAISTSESKETVFLCEHCGQNVACGCSELEQNRKPKVVEIFSKCPTKDDGLTFTRPSHQNPKPTLKLKIPSLTDDDIFMCEHFGQAVACGCFELATKKMAQAERTSPRRNGDVYLCERCGHVECTCPDSGHKDKSGVSSHATGDDSPVCQQCGPGVECACSESAQKEQPKFKYPPRRCPSDDDIFSSEHHGQDIASPELSQEEKDRCKES